MKFGAYLKRLRQRANLTQGELARRCGLSDAYINQLETAKADPPTRQVCKVLARALGVDRNDLWKYAFTARLERWLQKEGYGKIRDGLTSTFFDNLSLRE